MSEAQHPFAVHQHLDRFGALVGYKMTAFKMGAREARVALTVGETHLSPSGKAHGGVLSTLLDYACGAAVVTTLGPSELCSTVELKVNYFRPVVLGDELEAHARVVFRGKKLCALQALLHANGGAEPVAMATATFNVTNPGVAP